MGKYNLYEQSKSYFRLIGYGETIEINEPVDFNKAQITLARDEESYGFAYEYFDENNNLTFDYRAGSEWIRQKYEQYGPDTDIILTFSQDDGLGEFEIFRGNLKFGDYKRTTDGITVPVERTSFRDLFRTRFDVALDLLSDKTLDNEVINKLRARQMTLHSRAIQKAYFSDLTDIPEAYLTFAKILGYWNINPSYFYPKTDNSQYNQIDGADIGQDTACFLAFDKTHPTFRAEEEGNYTFEINFQSWLSHETPSTSIDVYLYIQQYDADSDGNPTNRIWLLNELLGNTSKNIDLDFSRTFTLYFKKNQRLYYNIVSISYSFLRSITNIYRKNDFKITAQTYRPPSSAEIYDFVDAFKQAILIGCNGKVKSDFLDSQYHKYSITNGFNIRRFSPEFKTLQTSISDYWLTLASLWNLGYTFTFDEQGNEVLRVEQWDWFYRNQLIKHFPQISDYSEETAKSLLVNEFEIGYENYPDDSENEQGLDEFNTERSYLFNLKTVKKKREQKTPFIAAGYSIEQTRRLQFSEEPTTSSENDDSIFIITMKNSYTAETSEPFKVCENTIDIASVYNARITPARMFRYWLDYFRSVLGYVPFNAICQFWKNNGDFTTELYNNDAYTRYTENIQEKQPFSSSANPKFLPTFANFKAHLTNRELVELKNNLLGINGGIPGFITFVSDKGIKNGWIYTLSYQPIQETVTIKALIFNSYVEKTLVPVIAYDKNTAIQWGIDSGKKILITANK